MFRILLDQPMEITHAQGQSWLVLNDGSIKIVQIGDLIPKGALLVSKSEVELSPPAQLPEASEAVQPAASLSTEPLSPSDQQELAAIQQAILNGEDPTEIAQATASGGDGSGLTTGSGNAGAVVTDRTNHTTISNAGFDTAHDAPEFIRYRDILGEYTPEERDHDPVAFSQSHIISEDTQAFYAQVPTAQDIDTDGINPHGYALVTDVDKGHLVLNPDGSYVFIPPAEFQSLREGETRQVSFTYIATDPKGNQSAPATVTITITGANDVATIDVATPGADQGVVKEDVTLTTGGKLVATDVDNGEAVFQPQTAIKGAHGSFTIDADGNWSYQLDNDDPAVQALKEGETLPSEHFVVKSADGSAEHTVTVTITGTNDDATISVATPGADQGAVKEDITLTTGGKLVATDVDNGEAVFQPQTAIKGAHGSFTIDADGNWSYQLDNNDPTVQALKEGETLPSEHFVVKSADGSAEHTVTVTITGTNDDATIGVATPGADQGAVKEDVTLTTGGKLVATDVDNGEAVFQPQTAIKGAHGSFTIDADGNWRYQLDNNDPAVQALKEGETLPSEHFVVKSADGSAEHTVTVTITGTNDNATISVATPGADQGAVKEDITLTTGGKLVATDVDNGEAVFQPQTAIKGAHGSFTIDADGNWNYQLDNDDPAVQALKEGETLPSEHFVVQSADGSAEHTVTVTITGTNDNATIDVATPGADQGAVKEDVTLITGGKLVATDVDNGEAMFQPQTAIKGAHGSFTIDADGNWRYQLDNDDPAVQALKEGETLPSEHFVVQSADGSAEHTVTVSITGTNEAPDARDDGLSSRQTVTLNGENWDTSGDIKVDYYVIDATTGTRVADAEKSDYTGDGDHRFGVKSDIEQPEADAVQAGQIGYLDSEDKSEAMRFTFQQGQLAHHASIEVRNLWSDRASGGWEPGCERGVWKAFYKGELVTSGIFEGTSGGKQTLQIDAAGRYFDSIEMSAIGYKDGIVDPQGSEYFITKVTADLTHFDQAFQTNETGSLSLDVLSNDSDPNQDAIAIVEGSYPDYVTLVDGKLFFDPAKYLQALPAGQRDLLPGEAKSIEFEYSIRDTHGATDKASVNVTIIGDPLSDPALLHVELQESDLGNGTPARSEGLLPGAHEATPHEYRFAAQQDGSKVSSGGNPLAYEVSQDGLQLTGFIVEGGQRVDVLSAQLDPQNGSYQLDLFRPLDHGSQGKDLLSLPFEMNIQIGNQQTQGQLIVDIIDSAPTPASITHTVGDVAPQSNSVIIALDMSGSMKDYVRDGNGQWTTRWSISQQAIKAMFEQYDKMGDVQFKIATHAGYPDGQTSGWLHSLEDIQKFFDTLSPAGWTPYYQALNQVDAILGNQQDQTAMEGTSKQFYFLSDGAPSDFGYWASGAYKSQEIRDRLMSGISPDEVGGEKHYQDLLNGRVEPTKAEQFLILGESMDHIMDKHGHPFDNMNMLAIGKSASLEYLEPLAGKGGSAIQVEDADVVNILTESVPGQLHGDLTQHSVEGEWVQSLNYDGRTYFYDQAKGGIFLHDGPADNKVADGAKLTLDTTNGKLALNFETGQYDYQAKDIHGNGQDKFLLTLRDGDGDTADTSLAIDVTDLQGGISPSPLTLGAQEKASYSVFSAPLLGSEAQDELIVLPTGHKAAEPTSPVETRIAVSDLLSHDEMDGLLARVAPVTQDATGTAGEPRILSEHPAGDTPDSLSQTMPNPVFDELLSQQQFIQ
ncbi:MAG: retention module-containing protein [Aeromonas sp.]|uniref:retention module-containing protein n=1 Tax=Aeromonas sp. TaxID=647 RepID=UPI003F3376CE